MSDSFSSDGYLLSPHVTADNSVFFSDNPDVCTDTSYCSDNIEYADDEIRRIFLTSQENICFSPNASSSPIRDLDRTVSKSLSQRTIVSPPYFEDGQRFWNDNDYGIDDGHDYDFDNDHDVYDDDNDYDYDVYDYNAVYDHGDHDYSNND